MPQALKSVHVPHLGINVKFGRKAPRAVGPHFRFAHYALLGLVGPDVQDYSQAAMSVIALVLLNDQLGDCVPAGLNHIMGVATGNAGALVTPTNDDVLKDYEAIGGYVPGDPSTDQGCDEVTALNYYCTKGWVDGTKGAGWLSVNATDPAQCKAALYVGENLVFGLALPAAWIDPFPSAPGFVWDVAGDPVPENGHCVVAVGCNSVGIQIATWGMIGTITWAAVAKYAVQSAGGALYVILTPDMIAKASGNAPNGVSWHDLIVDFDSMGGHVPVPVPPTPPSPPPTPAGAPTLAQAQGAAKHALDQQYAVLTRTRAESVVAKALASLPGWPT